MAYISTAEVKAIREELKKEFPEFKFGVRKRDWHAVSVTLKKGPALPEEVFTHGEGYAQLNQYYPENYGAFSETLKKIIKIIKTAPAKVEGGREWYDNSDAMTDYFDTAFYMDVNVGDWNKPYQVAA